MKIVVTAQVSSLMIQFKNLSLEIFLIFINILPKNNIRNKKRCKINVKNFTETLKLFMDARSLQVSVR